MEVEVIPVRVKPATVKKLQAEVARQKQEAATDRLLAELSTTELQQTITALEKRVDLLEQP